ncbi:hypothetical protein AB0D34_07235 [Streptomyces sp. NPDC048420]
MTTIDPRACPYRILTTSLTEFEDRQPGRAAFHLPAPAHQEAA